MTHQLLQTICTERGWPMTDDLVIAFEAACITEEEYRADKGACIQRLHGAIEEMTDFDF